MSRGSGGIGQHRRNLDILLAVCREDVGGERLIDRPSVYRKLAELKIELNLARLLAYQTVAMMDQGLVPSVAGAKEKIASAELRIKLADFATQILGPTALLSKTDPAAPANGMFEVRYRQSPLFYFVGGANDVLRDMIAQAGHGLPRSARTPEGRGPPYEGSSTMDLMLSDEQTQLQDSLRRLFAERCPTTLVRRLRLDDGGDDLASLWEALSDAGLLGLALPAEIGGGEGSLIDVGVLVEEAGRALAPALVKGSVLFGLMVQRLGHDGLRQRWLPRLCDDGLKAAVILDQSDRIDRTIVARPHADGWVLSGAVDLVRIPEVCQAVRARCQNRFGRAPGRGSRLRGGGRSPRATRGSRHP